MEIASAYDLPRARDEECQRYFVLIPSSAHLLVRLENGLKGLCQSQGATESTIHIKQTATDVRSLAASSYTALTEI